MKRHAWILVGLLVIAGLMTVVPAHGQTKDIADMSFAELADLYAQRAKEQASIITEHQAMKSEAQQAAQAVDLASPEAEKQREMVRHCQRIVSAAQSLRNEYQDLVRWYGGRNYPFGEYD